MKTLIDHKITVDSDKITITATIAERPFAGLLTPRVTHGHMHPENMRHGRHIQSSSEAVFVKSSSGGFSISNDMLVAIAAAANPNTSFAPVLKASEPGKVNVISESEPSFQWQVSDDAFPKGQYPAPAAVWNDIAGATSASLDESLVKINQWIRCVVKNATGTAISAPAQKK